MNKELRNLILMVGRALKQYEEDYGDELFPSNREITLQKMYYKDLVSYALVLCTLEGPVTSDRIRQMNFYIGTNLKIEDGQRFYEAMESIREGYLDDVPTIIKAVVLLENFLQKTLTCPILNSLILVYDYLTQSLVTCGCVSEEELSWAEMQFGGEYLDNIREYANEHYFDASLIEGTSVYDVIDTSSTTQKSDNRIKSCTVTISAGDGHAVGIKNDGTAIAVGDDDRNQCGVFLWDNLVSVAAGSSHTVGITKDGKCVATGPNSEGECDVKSWENVKAISAGFQYTVGLATNGTVLATGKNSEFIATVFSNENLVSISTRSDHVVGLRSDGTVIAYGDNSYGQCNVEKWTDIIAVSAGYEHTLGLKRDGTVVATGLKQDNRCEVWSWRDVIAISAGAWHSVGLCKDGTVLVVGVDREDRYDISQWRNIVSIAAGANFTLGLRKDGTVVSCGEDEYGQCDASEWGNIKLPVEM